MFFVSYVRRSAKILILNKEWFIEKISYERRAYESVDEKSLSWVTSRKTTKKKNSGSKGLSRKSRSFNRFTSTRRKYIVQTIALLRHI